MAEKKSLKTILIGAALVLVAVGLSVGATVFVLSSQQPDSVAAEAAETVTEIPPLQYHRFGKPFIATVAHEGRTRHMQVHVALAYRDPAVEPALATHAPLLRSRLLTVFGRGDFMVLQTGGGRQSIKTEALSTVNQVLENEGAPPVDRVLFTNFVLQ